MRGNAGARLQRWPGWRGRPGGWHERGRAGGLANYGGGVAATVPTVQKAGMIAIHEDNNKNHSHQCGWITLDIFVNTDNNRQQKALLWT